MRKQKFTNKVCELIIIIIIIKQNRAKKKKVGKFDETRPKKFWARSEKKKFFASETLRCSERKQKITNKVRDLIITFTAPLYAQVTEAPKNIMVFMHIFYDAWDSSNDFAWYLWIAFFSTFFVFYFSPLTSCKTTALRFWHGSYPM